MKLGGCPPSGGGGRSGRRALIGTARACLCWGFAGGLGAWVLAVCGLVGGPIANFTVGFARVLPAVAGQGNPRPDGSAARRMRASVHITCPLPSRRTRAGMVDTPNRVPNDFPSVPAAVAWGTAVHLGIEWKYRMVSASEASRETNTMVALLCRRSNATRERRNGPQCGQDSLPKNKPTTDFP